MILVSLRMTAVILCLTKIRLYLTAIRFFLTMVMRHLITVRLNVISVILCVILVSLRLTAVMRRLIAVRSNGIPVILREVAVSLMPISITLARNAVSLSPQLGQVDASHDHANGEPGQSVACPGLPPGAIQMALLQSASGTGILANSGVRYSAGSPKIPINSSSRRSSSSGVPASRTRRRKGSVLDGRTFAHQSG